MPSFSELLDGLSRPEAYPHSVEGLHPIQTHASVVFLTGQWAYKIKKPVDFGFLDYRSLEARRRCCEAEVTLNRRLCPEVYLGVVPITASAQGLRVDGTGEPVEWAVRMRQLPEADLLSHRLRTGRVTPGEITKLACKLASFHARAEERRELGSVEAVRGNVEENFRQTEGRTGALLPAAHLEAVRAFSLDFLERQGALLRKRMEAGRIRDGHGDLRAQNICLAPDVGDGIQVLDCIEFNERFRCGDVAADLAYLAMDLDLAGRRDLSEQLVDAYVEESGDSGLAEVLTFYLCYRAYVRGKIALLAAEETEIPEPERQEHAATAAAAFDLGRSYATLTGARLAAMVGYSGSGKSGVARELARRLPAVRFSSDEVRKERAGVPRTQVLAGEAYSAASRGEVYTALLEHAAESLRAGISVLLDATFLDPEERERVRALGAALRVPVVFLECQAPDELIRERLRGPRGDASDAGLQVYQAQAADRGIAAALAAERASRGWVALDAALPPGRAARQALEALWRVDSSGGTP